MARNRRLRRVHDSPEERSSSSDEESRANASIPDFSLRWGSLSSHTLYHTQGFATRSYVREKVVNLQSLHGTNVYSWLSDLGWDPLFSLTDPIFPDLIREFYFRMYDKGTHVFSRVRDREIIVSPDSIAQLLPLPRVNNPSYPWTSDNRPDPTLVLNTVFRYLPPGTVTIYHKHLHPDFMVLNWIVCACLIPRANTTQITKMHMDLMFAISIRAHIDLPSFLFNIIRSVRILPSSLARQALPFAAIITRFCLAAGCPRVSTDVPITKYQSIDMSSVSRSRGHLPPDTPHLTPSTSSHSATSSHPAPSRPEPSRSIHRPSSSFGPAPVESENFMFVRSQVEQLQEDRRQDRELMQELLVTM